MYKTMRDRLEKELQPHKERAEKAEREANMYREQLVKNMDDKDQLHMENRKLQVRSMLVYHKICAWFSFRYEIC